MPEMRDLDLDDAFQNTNFVPDRAFKQRLHARLMHPRGASIEMPAPSPNGRHRRLFIPTDDSDDSGSEAASNTAGFVPAFAGLIMILLVAALGVSVLLPGGLFSRIQDMTVTPTPAEQRPTDTPQPTADATMAPSTTQNILSEEFEVPYEDRVIRGTLMGDGDLAVIVAPGYLESRAHFMPLSEHVASLGYTAAAIDFPGFGGASTGTVSYSQGDEDVLAVMGYLNARGYERIVCIGGSLGGPSCLNAALARTDMAGLVIITAYIQLTQEDAAALTMPKLLIMGSHPDNLEIMRTLFTVLPAPKELMTVTASAQSSELLRSEDADAILHAIAAFLDELR